MAENLDDAKRDFEELMKVLGDKSGALAKALEILNARVGAASDAQQKSNKYKLSEKQVLEETKSAFKDYARQLDRGKITQEEYDAKTRELGEKLKDLTHLTGDQRKQIFESMVATRKKAEAEVFAEKITTNFNKTVEKTTTVLAPIGAAIGGIWKGSQNATNAIAGSSEILKTETRLAGSAATGLGQAMQSGGTAMMASSNKLIKGLGIAGNVAGLGFQQVGKSAELVNSVFGELADKAQQLQQSYTKINQSGATFAGGMSELRDIAGSAGMKVNDLVGGIGQAQETFESAGLSVTQATKMIGTFGKGLSQGKAAADLFAMGFTDVQDRVRLAAGAFDQARSTGMSRAEAEKNITALTVQYGKDLKTLQSIAGKDAEKALEKGRLEAQRGSLMAKLSNDQRDAYSKVYASLDRFGPQADKVRLALTQLAQGGAITDPDILINQPMKEMIEQMAGIVQSGSKDAIEQSGRAIGEAADKARLDAQTGGIMSQIDAAAVQMGKNADGIVAGSTGLNNALLATKIDPAVGEEARKNVENLTSNTDAITKNLSDVDQKFRQLSVAMEQVALSDGVMANFTKLLDKSLAPLTAMIDKMKEFGNMDISKMLSSKEGGGAGSNMMGMIGTGVEAAAAAATVATLFKRGGGPGPGASTSVPPTGPTGPKIPPGGLPGAAETASSGVPKIKMPAAEAAAQAAETVGKIPTPGAAGASGAAANMAGAGGKSVTGAVLKAGGQGLAKLIPGVGLVMSGLDAYEKVQQGDFVGAALAGAGGLASLIPGIGTLASTAIATASALREISPSITPISPTDVGAPAKTLEKEKTETNIDKAQQEKMTYGGIVSPEAAILEAMKDTSKTTSASVDLLTKLNQNIEDLLRATRDVVTNTDRTARGVQ